MVHQWNEWLTKATNVQVMWNVWGPASNLGVDEARGADLVDPAGAVGEVCTRSMPHPCRAQGIALCTLAGGEQGRRLCPWLLTLPVDLYSHHGPAHLAGVVGKMCASIV